MTTETITLPIIHLNAIRLFSANKDVREHLNSVAIDESHLVATNGRYLGALPIANCDKDIKVIIPNEAIKLLFHGLRGKAKTEGDVFIIVDGENSKLIKDGIIIIFTPIDQKFPNWKILVKEIKNPENHDIYDWEHMALFQKAAKLLVGKFKKDYMTRLIPDGPHNSAKVEIILCPKFIGLTMPMRDK